MNRILLSFLVLATLWSADALAQCSTTITASSGYTVSISLQADSIIPSTTTCPWGYNYNVAISYTITLNGSKAPASLHTLQGTLGCGGSSHFFDLPNSGGTGTVISGSNVWNGDTTCNSSTPSSLSCTSFTIEIQGPGISQQFIACNSSVLPTELLSSYASRTSNQDARIDWTTATETNNGYFDIERSLNGTSFDVIGTVPGAGNSSQQLSYSFYDSSPSENSAYYRIRQTDYDGRSETFKSMVVRPLQSNGSECELTITPNPCVPNCTALLKNCDTPSVQLNVLDISGNIVQESIRQKPSDSPIDFHINKNNNLVPGIYIVSTNSALGKQSKKIIVK